MSATDVVEVSGHIIDSLILAKILDEIIEAEADYRIVQMDVGKAPADLSRARIEVTAASEEAPTRSPSPTPSSWPPPWTACSRRASTPRPTCRRR
jgi:hypothetical protein